MNLLIIFFYFCRTRRWWSRRNACKEKWVGKHNDKSLKQVIWFWYTYVFFSWFFRENAWKFSILINVVYFDGNFLPSCLIICLHFPYTFFRSWDKVCVVLKGTKLLFYKDQKSYRSSPDHLYRGEPPMELQNGTAEIATDYTKKRHVFRLK